MGRQTAADGHHMTEDRQQTAANPLLAFVRGLPSVVPARA